MDIQYFFSIPPYSLNKKDKLDLFNNYLNDLTRYHYNNCIEYKKIIDSQKIDINSIISYTKLPFLPVRLFKMFNLYSIPKENIIKTMTSSGTSGQEVSKIFLDKETSLNQSKSLTKIVSSFLGSRRSPMLIIDSEDILENRNMLSARGAGILGFSIFGTKRIYALDKNMKLKVDLIIDFLNKNKNERIFIFGFTFMIYKHFIQELIINNPGINLSKGVLIHGGGWKKLISEQIDSKQFRLKLNKLCGIESVFDYYGMVEQTGSIFMECEKRHLHAPVFSDIIIRRSYDFSIAPIGEEGIIQTVSLLPRSYPGHSLLTEDEGIWLGEDDCSCGRLGKYFRIIGRIKNAEIRGCSDTYAEQF